MGRMMTLQMTYIGGPTLLLEVGGLRILTDPTLDPAGGEYKGTGYSLFKTQGPAIEAADVEPVDVVLLSHDHHFDNLDSAGRELLARVPLVLTTEAGAERLGGTAIGLAPGDSHELSLADGSTLRVTATPARHGPPGGDRGPSVGFLLEWEDGESKTVYLSGDTVWYEGVEEIARNYPVQVAVLYAGAAKVSVVGPEPLTFTAEGAVEAARAFKDAIIVPVHFEGWKHFSEGRAELEASLARAGLEDRVRWLAPGQPEVF